MRPPRPRFEVIIPTTNAAERRLVTAQQVREIIGSEEADDAKLERIIDFWSAACARYCDLARAGTAPPTFGRESVRAIFAATTCHRGAELLLPWRVPVVSVAVTEGGAELTDADFSVDTETAILTRASGCWGGGEIVVEYRSGWILAEDASAYEGDTDPVPDDLVGALIDQVKMAFFNIDEDPSIRSENVPDVWSGSYSIAGGDSIGTGGLLKPLEAALSPFKKLAIA